MCSAALWGEKSLGRRGGFSLVGPPQSSETLPRPGVKKWKQVLLGLSKEGEAERPGEDGAGGGTRGADREDEKQGGEGGGRAGEGDRAY